MRSIAERVKDRSHVISDRIREFEYVERRNRHIFGEGAVAVDADAQRIHAQVAPAGAAIAAYAASNVSLGRNAVADSKAIDFAAHLDDFAAELVADVVGTWIVLLAQSSHWKI